MPTYYFDMRDGVPIRDRVGPEFPTDLHAIEHSKTIATNIRVTIAISASRCSTSPGTEIHQEPVYPDIG